VSVYDLVVGDEIYSYFEGERIVAKVKSTYIDSRVEARELVTLTTVSGNTLTLTADEPVYVPTAANFVLARELTSGRRVQTTGGEEPIIKIDSVVRQEVIYTINTDHESHNYFANGILVHNYDQGSYYKQGSYGCFAGDTLIATPNGDVSISELAVGDEIYSSLEGERIVTRLSNLLVQDGVTESANDFDRFPLFEVLFTDGSTLSVTGNHPLYSETKGGWLAVELFSVGDKVAAPDGTKEIASIERTADMPVVYNLETDHKSQNYYADGILAHTGLESRDGTVHSALVATPQGDVSVYDLAVGDEIYSYYEGERIVTRVQGTSIDSRVDARDLYTLTLAGGGAIVLTAGEPVYVPATDEYVDAEKVTIGIKVLTTRGPETVLAIERDTHQEVVYTITTDHESHNYFANGVLVHNYDQGSYYSQGSYYKQAAYYSQAAYAMPDLTPLPLSDFTVSDNTPTVGQTITLGAIVKNTGTANSVSFNNRFEITPNQTWDGYGINGDDARYTGLIPGLNVGANRAVSVNWTPTSPGTFYVRIRVDNEENVVESSEINNRTSYVAVTVSPAPPKPNVTIQVCDLGGGNCVSNGSTKAITTGNEVEVRWNATNATSCNAVSGAGYSTGGTVSGTDTTITEPAEGTNDTYRVTCQNGSQSTTESVTVVTNPSLSPNLVPVSGSIVLNGGTLAEGSNVSFRARHRWYRIIPQQLHIQVGHKWGMDAISRKCTICDVSS
jgi:intein/homing endonuclease